MDKFGQVFIGIAIVAVLAAIIGFWFLSRHGPRGSVLVVAVLLYFLSYQIQPGNSRELVGLVGILRLTGLMGGILGIIDLVRRPKKPSNNPDAK